MKYFVTPREELRLDELMRQRVRGSFVELSDGMTHYELTGPENGDLIVLIGGLVIPLFYWDDVASALRARGLRTLAYSGYGRGYSDRVRGRYDEALFVRQLMDLVDRLGLTGRHHVVGTSMGALVAMAYAEQRPASIATLTLIGPAGLSRPPLQMQLLKYLLGSDWLASSVGKRFGHRWLERHLGHEIREPIRAAAMSAMVREAYRCEGSMYALLSTLQNFMPYGRAALYQRAGALGMPTMLVWGAGDLVTPIEGLEVARTLLMPQECRVIDSGHMVPFERPGDVADEIASFVAMRSEGAVA